MLISTRRTFLATQGAESNYKDLSAEPSDHAIGRSRGGLSTKIHHLVDGKGGPLVVLTLSLVVFAVHVPMLIGFTVARYHEGS